MPRRFGSAVESFFSKTFIISVANPLVASIRKDKRGRKHRKEIDV